MIRDSTDNIDIFRRIRKIFTKESAQIPKAVNSQKKIESNKNRFSSLISKFQRQKVNKKNFSKLSKIKKHLS